ncbi:MAG: penicillin-binding protein [Lachnospiraceae bacterium]|nr:penicillin-binding protein [Lachnospiraceae bacterium]
MFEDIREWIKNIIFSRLFVLLIVFAVLFTVLVQKLFVLQIVNGEDYQNNFTLTIKKETTINSTRGNIYDRNGKLLAYNELAYSVTIEDTYEAGSKKNESLNETIRKTIDLIESHGDQVVHNFQIIRNDKGEYEYSITGTRLLRFLADIYGHTNTSDLEDEERNATPTDVINYLISEDKYAIGHKVDRNGKEVFVPKEGYTDEEILKIITIRYALSTNAYQKYLSTVIASDVGDETVAVIMENQADLPGVGIEENTLRHYNDSKFFAHILGYTGAASAEDLAELRESEHEYNMNDTVGKAGVEKAMESYLQGTKGKDVIYVDNVGKVIETAEHIEPQAGCDVYLSLDSDLQKAVYNMLEQKLAGILVGKIVNVKEYDNSAVKSSSMKIPIDDVYYALFNNNVISVDHMRANDAGTFERLVYQNYLARQDQVLNNLKQELLFASTPYNQLPEEYQVYESYIVNRLSSNNTGVLISDRVDKEDDTYIDWTINETISLRDYLNYAISKNWIDISKFDLGQQYSSSNEVYEQLVDFILNDLKENNGFSKRIFKYMIFDDVLTGQQICMILYEQKIIYGSLEEKTEVETGAKSAYDFIINKISNIEITPAQLALDPCSGSCIVTGINGELLAVVTYPGYDVNKLANSIDADYYAKLMNDLASPMYNNATQQMTAPGSTFKMLTSVAGLSEGVVLLDEPIYCRGVWDTLEEEKHCWCYPGHHGDMDVINAIGNSCNCYFYEVGYRLATNLMTELYSEKRGLERLKFYADQFGLTEKTGIEMEENEPKFSDTLPVDSAIGQGSHNYTTIGLSRYLTAVASKGNCYNFSLVDHVEDHEGRTVATFGPVLRNRIDLPPTTWDAVHQGMRIVVQKAAAFRGFHIQVAGKTGTAQTSRSRTNHALFLGFAPYEDPEITVSVRIAYGYTSGNAAALASDIFKYYFELEDRTSLINGIANTEEAEDISD